MRVLRVCIQPKVPCKPIFRLRIRLQAFIAINHAIFDAMSKSIRLKRLSLNNQLCCWVLIIYMSALFACAGTDTRVDLEKLSGVKTILVLPFQHRDDVEVEPVFIDCNLCRQRHVFEAVATDDASYMSARLQELLHDDGTHQYVFQDRTTLTAPDLNDDSLVHDKFGRIITLDTIPQDVDAVLMGYIFRFRERVGKSYAIESPASVAFSLMLTDLHSEEVVWHSRYEETQEALFSNLLSLGKFIKRKARWVTARELASGALEDMLSTLMKP